MPESVDRLQSYAIFFVVIGVSLVVGLSVMAGVQGESYTKTSVLNETFNATSIPHTYTVSHESDADFHEVLTATCYTDTSQSSEQACEVLNGTNGEINVTEGSADVGLESIDYDYDYEGSAFEGAGKAIEGLKTFTTWLPLIALVIVAGIIIMLVDMFRGGTRTARA